MNEMEGARRVGICHFQEAFIRERDAALSYARNGG